MDVNDSHGPFLLYHLHFLPEWFMLISLPLPQIVHQLSFGNPPLVKLRRHQ